jgi:hypothetical protein
VLGAHGAFLAEINIFKRNELRLLFVPDNNAGTLDRWAESATAATAAGATAAAAA